MEQERRFTVFGVAEAWNQLPVDGLLFAVGYESRSRFVAASVGQGHQLGLGLRFGSQEDGSFSDNLEWCGRQPRIYAVVADTEDAARTAIAEWLQKLAEAVGARPLRVVVDVSSLSRMLMAAVISTFLACASDVGGVDATFVYAPARFTPPSDQHGPITKFGAVLPQFAGVSDPSRSLGAVIGLGYEPDLALATQQGLDPAACWLLVPSGVEHAYDEAVSSANSRVLAVNDPNNVLPYDVLRPFDTFMRLESLVSGFSRAHNVVLVPFGPKILALVCLLVAIEHAPDVGVWRVSAGRLGPARDVEADGRVTGSEWCSTADGVAGGITSAARTAWRKANGIAEPVVSVDDFLPPELVAADRGQWLTRSEPILKAVAEWTNNGDSARTIGGRLGVSTRAVARYRQVCHDRTLIA